MTLDDIAQIRVDKNLVGIIGMKQILGARRIHVFLDWQWQRYVVRRALLGPVGRSFPASYLQTHKRVRVTMTEEVAAVHPLLPE